MSNEKIKALFAVLTAVFIVWFIVFSGWRYAKAIEAGGTITNQAPTVATGPTGDDPGNWDNSTANTETYTGTVQDTNGEVDIAFVNLTSFGPGDSNGPLIFSNNTTAGVTITSEPGSGPGIDVDGITIWNTTDKGGILTYKARRTFNASATGGTYYQWLNVTDRSASTASNSETTVLSVYTHVTWTVVFRNNTTDGAGIWAFSNATQSVGPTSTNVDSTNWLRALNDGTGDATLSIQFANFTATDVFGVTWTINLTTGTNMKFRYNSTTATMNDTTNTTFGSAVNGSVSGDSAGGTLVVGAYRYFEYRIVDVSTTDTLYTGTYSGTVTASYAEA